MARIVCAAPPLFGHATPLAALSGELARRGHTVVFLDSFSHAFALPGGVSRVKVPAPELEGAWQSSAGDNALTESLVHLEDYAVSAFEPLLQASRDGRPDLIVFDQQIPVAHAIARELGCPLVTSITSPFLFAGADGAQSALNSSVEQAFAEAYRAMCERVGRTLGCAMNETGFSPDLNLCFAPAGFCDPDAADRYGVPLSLVGPAFLPRTPDVEDEALADQLAAFDGRRLLVSLGSCLTGASGTHETAIKLFRNILIAHNDPDALLLFVAPDELVRQAMAGLTVRARVLSRSFINQCYLMPHFSLVFSHGGYNTLAECLHHGIPLIASPFLFDQARMAYRLEQLGVGARVSRVRHKPEQFRRLSDNLLTDATARQAQSAMKTAFRASSGARDGADAVERFLAGFDPVARS
ncbi:glycosyltransferase [Saccharospirillum salsuginis]|uniref:Oleandomycin glycosyltransferase n=1 Tax=Saccharospirillum salsuginis TaxID=418750 RepID=A0A918KNP1_9GAMM|nr:glycosyltransferase [Saccharospirillum salsuginis]GGX67924.1 oleandomycin glycosyltransferase [Saccharospirillum salsuginis]